jgi:PAS domain S-box-containing protein
MPDSAAASSISFSALQDVFPTDDLLQGLLDASLTGVALYKPIRAAGGTITDLEIVLLNPAAQQILSLPARPTGTYLQLFPHTLATGVFDFHCRAFASDKVERYNINYQGDGLDNYFHLSARRVGDGLLVSFSDTADQDRSAVEEALRESQARAKAARADAEAQRKRLETLFMDAPAMITIFAGPEHTFKLVNPLYQQLVGPRPLLGKPIREAMPELIGQPIFELLDRVYQTGEPFYATEMMVKLDHTNSGELGNNYYNFIYQPTYDLAGVVDGILVFAYEVTTQVRARHQIELQEHKLRLLNEKLASTNEKLATANAELQNANVEILANNEELFQTQIALQELNQELEAHIADRTAKLRRALQEAQLQRERLRAFLLQMPAPMCVFRGPNHVYELVNSHYQQRFGNRQLIGLPLQEAVPELVAQGYLRMLDRVYQTGEVFFAKETRVWISSATKSGNAQESYFDLVLQATYNDQGAIDGIIHYALDVTEHVLARQQLKQNEERLQLALEASNMASFNLDLLTNQIERSENHHTLFGYDTPLPEWNLAALLSHMLPEDQTEFQKNLSQAMNTGVLRLNPRIRRADGELRWLEARGRIFYDNAGKPMRVAGVITDVTERERARQQLQTLTEQLADTNEVLRAANAELGTTNQQLTRTNADLDSFVYTASHDLKQPVNNMAGVFEELKRTATFHDPQATILVEMFETALEQINSTIQGLTEVVQVQRHSERLPAEHVTLLSLTQKVLQSMSSQSAASKADFQLDFSAVPVVYFARLSLQSILYNLLSNALKYAHPDRPPVIAVRTELTAEGIPTLVVQDNGLGIDMERHGANLFQLFRRFHDHVSGSGLGLYLVNRIVQQAGGRLQVESEVGTGTTFRIYFPITVLSTVPTL